MTRNAAKKFWKEYLKLSCAKGRDSTTLNPAHTFLAQARIGAFDSISDAEYASRLKDAEELCLFWDFRDTETAKNVLLNAMSSTDISDKDISNIAGILASASVRSNYSIENSDKDKATKSIHTIDRRHTRTISRTVTTDGHRAGWIHKKYLYGSMDAQSQIQPFHPHRRSHQPAKT